MAQHRWLSYIPFLSILLIFIIDFTFIFFTNTQWEKSTNKYIPIGVEYNNLRHGLAEGHLWLEESLSGDKFIDVEVDVLQNFNPKSFNKLLDDNRSILNDEGDQLILNTMQEVQVDLNEFYLLAKRRLENIKQSGIGSDIDQMFDHKFNTLLFNIDKGQQVLQLKLDYELAARKNQFNNILIIFFLVNSFVFVALFMAKRAKDEIETTLYNEKEKAEVTLHSIGDAVITTDPKGVVTFVNKVAESLTGYALKEAVGKPLEAIFDIRSVKTGEKVVSPTDKVLQEGRTVGLANGTKLVRADGQEFVISDSAAPILNSRGDLMGVVLVFQDDTERHHSEVKLLESENRYRRLVQNIKHHYFFYSHDLSGNFTFVSNSITQILGYSHDQFMVHYDEYLTDEEINDEVYKRTEKAMLGEQQEPYQLSIYHIDGSIKYLEISETPVRNDQGDVIAVEGVAKDITSLVSTQKNLKNQKEIFQHAANHDALTGLSNRVLFFDRLTQSLAMLSRRAEHLAVLFIDVDRFKEVNDSFGHHYGDQLLIEVAKRFKRCIRETDTLSRLGGDEFGILLKNVDKSTDVISIVENTMDALEKPFVIEGHTLYVTASIGISIAPEDSEDAQTLLKNADSAMYQAKDEGRNTYRFYTPEMTKLALERVNLLTGIKQALLQDQLEVYYQPQINSKTEQLVGVESLVRWNHPEKGLIMPNDFIPIIEETGTILQLDRWVMEQVMRQQASWYQKGLKPGFAAINLSIKQLMTPDFIEVVKDLLQSTGCSAEWLEFEVTETQIMRRPEAAIEVLNEVRSLGIRISVDDFGTGYSSLAYLKRLPLDKLKIDKSFVIGLPDDEDDVSITKAIIALSQSLRLDTLAEGVETSKQRDVLIEYGCYKVQGFLYSKALPAPMLEETYLN